MVPATRAGNTAPERSAGSDRGHGTRGSKSKSPQKPIFRPSHCPGPSSLPGRGILEKSPTRPTPCPVPHAVAPLRARVPGLPSIFLNPQTCLLHALAEREGWAAGSPTGCQQIAQLLPVCSIADENGPRHGLKNGSQTGPSFLLSRKSLPQSVYKKRTAPSVPKWSPTSVLTGPDQA